MKKSIKNTIMIGMAAILIGTSAVTISYAQRNRGGRPFIPQSQSQQFDNRENSSAFDDFGNNQRDRDFNQRQMPDNQQDGNNSQLPQDPNNSENSSTEKDSSSTDNATSRKSLPINGFKIKNIGAVSAICYIFASVQILIIIAIIAYLIISKFNTISFNGILKNMRKSNKKQSETP